MKKTQSELVVELDEARALSAKLEAVTNELNTFITKAEAAIEALGLGVHGSVVIDRSKNEGVEWIKELAFRKLNGKWRLLIECGMIDDDDVSVDPLVNASRADRLAAVEHFDALVRELLANSKEQLKEVQAGSNKVQDFIETISLSTK